MPLNRREGAIGALVLGLAGPAQAMCSIELSPVTFGVVDLTRRSGGTGEVVVRCDVASSFAVAISPGHGGSGTRRMSGPGGSRLDYQLFSDAGRSVPWGDGTSEGPPVTSSSNGNGLRRLTIYGAVPAQPGATPGEYLDSLEVTLTF